MSIYKNDVTTISTCGTVSRYCTKLKNHHMDVDEIMEYFKYNDEVLRIGRIIPQIFNSINQNIKAGSSKPTSRV